MFDMRAKPFYLSDEDILWVEQTFAAMNTDEKIAQVFVDQFWNAPPREIQKSLARCQAGGFRYNNRSAVKLHRQNTNIQKHSRIPALIAANVEEGGSGAVSGGTKIGDGIAIAATSNAENAYYMGYYGCREAAAVGCNWTFAPVVDVDMNWRNCVIPNRCFGSDVDTVLRMGLEYMRGANDAGIACCMKHFPGDGCDERDQHLLTTVNPMSCKEWDASYGKIYRGMIEAGVPSIMIGHIQLPEYSRSLRPGIKDGEIMPATLAPELLGGLLRQRLGFNGLILTDATPMAGLTSKMKRSEFLPRAIEYGCDMILYFRNQDEDMHFMQEGINNGLLSQERLDAAVLRVLAFKAMLKLHKKQAGGTLVPAKDALTIIGCARHTEKAAEIIDASITLVKNTRDQLPLSPATHRRIMIFGLENRSLVHRVLKKGHGAAKLLAEELKAQGFEPTVYKMNPAKYITLKGIDGKKAMSEPSIGDFIGRYDAVILIANISSFAVTNERSLHWQLPMGPEVPWYVTELPTVFISTAHPFHLLDVPMVPTYINTYNAGREAIRQTVEKLMGKSTFKGISPVDAFCGKWDTRL